MALKFPRSLGNFHGVSKGSNPQCRTPSAGNSRLYEGIIDPSSYLPHYWLVVEPTHLKNMSQIGNLPQIGMKIKKYLKPPPRLSSYSPTLHIESIDILINFPSLSCIDSRFLREIKGLTLSFQNYPATEDIDFLASLSSMFVNMEGVLVP